jgi:O-antigen/teichoic acid export membrane protein
MLVTLPVIYVLVVFGDQLIGLLYDDRYVEAGWMLRLLAAGTAFSAVGATSGVVLLAVGDSYRFMLMLVTQTFITAAGMGVGWHFLGLPGLLMGVAFSDLLNYPVLVLCIRRYGVWLPRLDFAGFGISALVVGLVYWLG